MVATTVRATVRNLHIIWPGVETLYIRGRVGDPALAMNRIPRKVTALMLDPTITVDSWDEMPPKLTYLNVSSGVIDEPRFLPPTLRVLTIGSPELASQLTSYVYLPEGIRQLTLYLAGGNSARLSEIPRSVGKLTLWNYEGDLADVPEEVTSLQLMEDDSLQLISGELPEGLRSLTIFGYEALERVEALPIGLYDLSIAFCPALTSCTFPEMLNSLSLTSVPPELELPRLLLLEKLSLDGPVMSNGQVVKSYEDYVTAWA